MGTDKHLSNRNEGKDDKEKWGLLLLAFSFLLIAAAVLVDQGKTENSSIGLSAPLSQINQKRNILNKIDHELKDPALREELLRQQTEFENATAAPVSDIDPNAYPNVNPISLDQDNHAQKVAEEIERRRRRSSNAKTLEERISSKVARDQWSQQYEQQKKEEFIRQFLDNAQKEGVGVQLNEDLDVTGLNFQHVEKPIRVPQSMPSSSK